MSNALQKLTYGLQILTTSDGHKHNGCIINTAMQLVSNPMPMISICVNKNNYTCDMIKENHKFTVSILSERASFDLFKHFGFQSGKDVDKFENFDAYKLSTNNTPIITSGTNAYIQAWVNDSVDLGTHVLFIATVTDMDTLNEVPSATYAYYQTHIKLKRETKRNVWICDICGYIYDPTIGDESQGIQKGISFEDLPKDYVCPICKQPKSDFTKQ